MSYSQRCPMNRCQDTENAAARQWLNHECHNGDVRRLLEHGLDYLEAVSRAGLPVHSTSGDELYEFLTDADATSARNHAFAPPTL